MGGCASGNARSYEQAGDRQFLRIRQKLSDSQFISLLKIYEDLASRDESQLLSIQNFQLFFHKNGFWGQRLFKQFDSDNNGHIQSKQFIKGVVRIFKTSQQEKIRLLYHFFQKQDQLGISFEDFVVVLYSYPKQDLKQIFNDEEFVETQIKKKLIQIRRNSTFRQPNQSSNKTEYVIQGSQNEIVDIKIQSQYGFKGIIEDLKKKQQEQDKTSMNLKVDGRNIEVKTSNIQHLVKKFARKLFKQYNINQKTGRLSYEDFKRWILGHKNLYTNYYEGFHPQSWQQDSKLLKPRYLTETMEKQSTGKMQVCGQLQIVHLFFLDSTIVICKQSDCSMPVDIICLDGLQVKKTFDQKKGFGFQVSHTNAFYPTKHIYLKNQQAASQWMQFLKFFKGISVQQQYEMGQKIGTGKFSIVYACKQKTSQKQYAMKVIQSQKIDADAKSLIAHESSIMSVLNYPLLVFFKQSIQTRTHLYIITQLVKGKDLYEYIRQNGAMKQVQAAKVIRQLILGVKHLHEIGIVHRDLKPQNIMIVTDKDKKESQSVKIIDFGFSNYIAALDSMDSIQLLAGTPNYIAPQVLKNQHITQKIDNFAIGSIIYFVLSATFAFNGHNIKQMLEKTMCGIFSFDKRVWRTISPQAKDLIILLLTNDPQSRITLEQALKHEWFIKTYQK